MCYVGEVRSVDDLSVVTLGVGFRGGILYRGRMSGEPDLWMF